jgi:hypothetical protein
MGVKPSADGIAASGPLATIWGNDDANAREVGGAGPGDHAGEPAALGRRWGVQAARHFTPRVAVEVMWTRQSSALVFSGSDLPSETKLALGFGGGLELFPRKAVGIRAQVRSKPVFLDDKDSGDFCVPSGFCQGWLNQPQLASGGVVRF